MAKIESSKEYVLTLSGNEAEALHKLIGNFSTTEILALGLSKEEDKNLEEIYSTLEGAF